MKYVGRLAKQRVLLFGAACGSLLSTGCATTGATFGSGVGDAFLTRSPYYAGTRADPATDPNIPTGHLAIAYQRGASQPAIFDPADAAMAELLSRMSDYLDALGMTRRLVPMGSSEASHPDRTPPDVQFHCFTGSGMPDDDCAIDADTALGRGRQEMRLAVARPSSEWIAWAARLADEAGVERTLVITLEVGQYLPRQRGLAGTKEVDLGTGHVARLPWLTSLETPVSVIQITGALIGRDGRAIRIGAEGLAAKRTPMAISAIGAQAVISEEDVAALLEARRDDLPGSPLTWEVGLRTLVAQLTGR